jgi:hypothetical protein
MGSDAHHAGTFSRVGALLAILEEEIHATSWPTHPARTATKQPLAADHFLKSI